MTSPIAICQQLTESVNDCLDCSFIDISSGRSLAQHRPSHSEHKQEHALISSLLNVLLEIAPRLQEPPPTPPHHSRPRELCITAADHRLLASTLPGNSTALVVTTGRDSSLGMSWAYLKAAIPLLEEEEEEPDVPTTFTGELNPLFGTSLNNRNRDI